MPSDLISEREGGKISQQTPALKEVVGKAVLIVRSDADDDEDPDDADWRA